MNKFREPRGSGSSLSLNPLRSNSPMRNYNAMEGNTGFGRNINAFGSSNNETIKETEISHGL